MRCRTLAATIRNGVALLGVCLGLMSGNAYAALTFTYQGRFLTPDGTAPLTDIANITFSIYNSSGSCLLEQEVFNGVDLSVMNGIAAVSIGTGTRTGSDPGLTMEAVLSNRPGVLRASAGDCVGGYSPSPTDGRMMQVHVDIPSRSISTDLAPSLRLDSVPLAYEAQKLQGYQASDFILAQTPVTQTNLSSLTNGSNADALHRHDAYVKVGSANAGFSILNGQTLGLGQIDSTSEGSLTGLTPGSVWFNSTTQLLKYYDGTNIVSIGASGVSGGGGGATTNFTGALTGDVRGTQSATVVALVSGVSAANVASGANAANAAVSINTPNTLIKRDGSGDFTAGTITATNFIGAFSGTFTGGISGNAAGFSGALSGDVTGGQTTTLINTVGGLAAGSVVSGANAANAATTANSGGRIVARDGSGNFSAGVITATLNGNSSTATSANFATTAGFAATATSAANFTGLLVGDVSGPQGATQVVTVGGLGASSVASGANAANAATSASGVGTIVMRDSSGNFSANTITATLLGTAWSATSAAIASSVSGPVTASSLTFGASAATGRLLYSTNSTGTAAWNSATTLDAAGNLNLNSMHTVGAVSVSGEVATSGGIRFPDGSLQTSASVGGVTGFTGVLAGDVTGTVGATTVALVGGLSAANVASGAGLANAATATGTTGAIVRRDAAGDFSAGVISAALNGNASTAGFATTAGSANTATSALYATSAGTASSAAYSTLASTATSAAYATVAATATSAAYATVAATATSASYATQAANASFATSASYATQSDSASLATSASYATQAGSASFATSAAYATQAGSASLATSASTATTANYATSASTATSANYATSASTATNANFATSASTATTANYATSASTATTANFATSAGNATSALDFTGSLLGDVTGTQGITVVSLVGGLSASGVATGANAANAATSTAATGKIVIRDASGNFSAGIITAALNGNAATATTANFATTAGSANTASTALYATTAAYAEITGSASTAAYATFASAATTANFATSAATATTANYATSAATATTANYATSAATASTANYATSAATATTANYATSALNFTGLLAGDVTGTQGATVISSVTVGALTGVLPVSKGGTNVSSVSENGVVYGGAGGTSYANVVGTSGQVLTASSGGAPTFTNSLLGLSAVTASGTITGATIVGAHSGTLAAPTGGLTVGVNQLVVTSTGVGIGTTGPTAPLSVVGNAYINGTVTATTFVGSFSGAISNLTGPIASSGNETYVTSQTGTGSTFVMSASPGISSPSISGGLNNNSGGITNAGAIGGLTTLSGPAGVSLSAGGAGALSLSTAGTGAFTVATSGATRMSILSNGYVGIGASPGTALTVGLGTLGSSSISFIGISGDWGDPVLTWKSSGVFRLGTSTSWDNGAPGWSEKMRITPGGNVGIGTETPSNRLSVAGNADFSGTVTASSFSGPFSGTNGTFSSGISVGGTGVTVTAGGASITGGINANSGGITNAGAMGGLTTLTGTSTLSLNTTGANAMSFATNGSTAMTLSSGGNVGIGTAAPNYKLDIRNGASGSGRQDTLAALMGANGANNGASILLGSSQTVGGYVSGFQGSATNNGYLTFGTQSSGAYVERMRIDETGNVGIGTTTLTTALTLTAARWVPLAGYQGVASVYSTDALGAGVGGGIILGGKFDAAQIPTEFAQLAGVKENATSGDFAGNLVLSTRAGGGSLVEAMRITAARYVGIGTTAPSNPLSVAGNANFSGTVTASSFSGTFSGSNGTYSSGLSVAGTGITTSGGLVVSASGANITGGLVMAGTGALSLSGGGGITNAGAIAGLTTLTGTSTLSLNTTGANAMSFATNGSTRMTIDSSGSVGIGTTTVPVGGIGAAKLAIHGTDSNNAAGPNMQFTTTLDNYPLIQILPFAHNNTSINFDAYYENTFWKTSGTTNSFSIYKINGALNFQYANTTASSAGSNLTWINAMTINGSGNVGIGTTSPSGPLHTVGNVIHTGGNVGIGTTSPGNTLQVNTLASNSGLILSGVQTANNTVGVQVLTNLTSAAWNGLTQAGDSGIIYNGTTVGTAKGFVIAPWNSGIVGIRMDGAGNVGIGTAAPTNPLSVAGNANFTGTVTAASFAGTFSGSNGVYTSGLSVAGTGITTSGGLVVSASGASIAGGLNNNSGGITNAGAIGGLTSLSGPAGVSLSAGGAGALSLSTAGTGAFTVATSGSTRMTVNSSGNVGIGIASPLARAHVVAPYSTDTSGGTSNPDTTWGVYKQNMTLLLDTGGARTVNRGGGIGFSNTDGFVLGAIKGAATNSNGAEYGGYLGFYTTGSDSGGTMPNGYERMRITETGNLGIGTNAPNSLLTVGPAMSGSALSTTLSTNAGALGNTTGDDLKVASFGFMTNTNASHLGVHAYRTSADTSWTGASIGLTMDVDDVQKAGAQLWLSNTGNVGIGGGMENPTAKLQVNGAVSVSGGGTFAGNGAFTGNGTFNGTLNVGAGPGSAGSSFFRTYGGVLGNTSTNQVTVGSIGFNSGNATYLGVHGYRFANGPDWTTTSVGLAMDVDAVPYAGGAQLWLSPFGNVGIGAGAENPNAKLQVNGTVSATNFTGTFSGTTGSYSGLLTASSGLTVSAGTLTASGGISASGGLVVSTSGASITGGINANSGGITNAGAIGGLTTLTGTTTLSLNTTGSNNMTFATSGSTAMTILANGKVGIGTTSPTGNLDVTGAGGGVLFVRDTAGTANALRFTNSGGINYIQSGVNPGSSTGADLRFTSMNAGTVYMTLTSDGNLGIGTTTPNYSLEVLNAGNAQLHVAAVTGDLSSIVLGPAPSNTNRDYSSMIRSISNVASHYGSQLAFYTHATTSNFSDPAERMRIDYNGNVGIGTTNPGQKLSVVGVVESTTGGFKFPDGSVQLTSATVGSNNSMVSGWPDAIRCYVTNPGYGWRTLYLTESPYVGNSLMYYRELGSGYAILYNADTTFNSSSFFSAATAPCMASGASGNIAAMYAAGLAFNFAKGPAGQWLQSGSNAYYNAGNVGIGTTSPTATLHVAGNATITGGISQNGWNSMSYLNSWANYGGSPPYTVPGYFKDTVGVIHLRGLVAGGTCGAYMFNLPAGYRPSGQSVFLIISNNAPIRLDIDAAGYAWASFGCNNSWVSLDGVTFKADN